MGNSSKRQGKSGSPLRTTFSISVLRKASRLLRRLAWPSREFMMKLQCKKAAYRRWKHTQAAKEEFRNIAWVNLRGVGKYRAQLELRLATGARRASAATLVVKG